MAQYAKLFSAGAAEYSLYRPQYSEKLFQNIYDFANLKQYKTVLDIATGTGQAAIALSPKFEKVIATDANAEQLKHFPKLSNAEVRAMDAHHTGLPDSSIDLVTIAQALHWLELNPFYKEVARVLTPDGAFAAWGYDLLQINNGPVAQAKLVDLYEGLLGPYWADRRKLVEKKFVGMEPGPEFFAEVERCEVQMPSKMTVQQLGGYISSWSAYQTYRSQHPDLPDPLPAFKTQLCSLVGSDNDQEALLDITWTIFCIMARKPVK